MHHRIPEKDMIQDDIISGKLKCLLLGNVVNYDEVRRSVLGIVQGQPSDVTQDGHPTKWTNPTGVVNQFNLFNSTGYDKTGESRIHLVWDCFVNKSVNNYTYQLLKEGKEVEPLYQSPINANDPHDTD